MPPNSYINTIAQNPSRFFRIIGGDGLTDATGWIPGVGLIDAAGNPLSFDIAALLASGVYSSLLGLLPVLASGIYNAGGIVLTNQQAAPIQFDASGNLKVTGSSGSSVPTAAYLSTLPTLTNGQTTPLLCAANGGLLVNPGVYSFQPTQTAFAVVTASTQLLPANGARKLLIIQNQSPTNAGPGAVTSATTNGSPTVTPTAMTNIQIGMGVTGTGIPSGSYIIAITASTFTMNNNATATNGAVSLTITGNVDLYVSTDGGSASTDPNCFLIAPRNSYTFNASTGVPNTLITAKATISVCPVCVTEGS